MGNRGGRPGNRRDVIAVALAAGAVPAAVGTEGDPIVAAVARMQAAAAIFAEEPTYSNHDLAGRAYVTMCKTEPTTLRGVALLIDAALAGFDEWSDIALLTTGMRNALAALKRLQDRT